MKKRSIRNSNNTSINTSDKASENNVSNVTTNEEVGGKKQKEKPYYSWW